MNAEKGMFVLRNILESPFGLAWVSLTGYELPKSPNCGNKLGP
jgi:hypothetical protein